LQTRQRGATLSLKYQRLLPTTTNQYLHTAAAAAAAAGGCGLRGARERERRREWGWV